MEQSKFYQIKNVTEHEYTLVGCDGRVITRPIQDVDKSASAFTIQDAKDGDVLACGNDIVIFKENNYNPKDQSGCMFVYCSCKNFYESGGINPTTYKPASKEQRDTLLKAMADSGYTFDFEKKELKEIQQKPTWSEEDEKQFSFCCAAIELSNYSSDEYRNYAISFLESLKDRVGCAIHFTTTKAWSEEDEAHFDSILKRLEGMCKPGATYTATRCSISEDKDWLKSLKEKFVKFDKGFNVGFSAAKYNQWKPSDEQMQVLQWCMPLWGEPKTKAVLESLIADLKKL